MYTYIHIYYIHRYIYTCIIFIKVQEHTSKQFMTKAKYMNETDDIDIIVGKFSERKKFFNTRSITDKTI